MSRLVLIRVWISVLLAAYSISVLQPARADSHASTTPTILDEVVVEEGDSPESELPLGTSVPGATLKDATGSSGDPFRGLQALPGFVFVDDESADPAVRGARPGDNLFEVDFIPLTYLSHADNAVSVFNSDLIDSFSIYSSAYGPEYSGVSGGVFDVRLRDPLADKFHATLDVNFLHAGLLLEGPVNARQSFYLAGRVSYLDVFVQDQLNDDTEYKQFPKYTDYQSKYVWRFNDRSTLRFQAIGAKDDFEAVVPVDNIGIDFSGDMIIRDFESTAFDQQGLVLDIRLSDKLLSKSLLAHTQSTNEEQNGGSALFDERNSQLLLKSYWEWLFDENHLLSFGASVSHDRSKSTITFDSLNCPDQSPECENATTTRTTTKEDVSTNISHIFIKDSWFATDQLTIFPGIVLLTESRSDKQFLEPRFSLEYSVGEDLILSAGVGLFHQDAELFQQSELYGNPDLDYIESVDWIIGAQQLFSNGWDVKAELYYKKLDNLVRRDETLVYNNSGEGQAYGLDTLIRKTLGDKLTGWLSFSLAEASRKNNPNEETYPFAFDQPYNISLVAKYALSRHWDIGAKLWLHSGAPYTPIIGASPDPNGSGGFIPEFGELNSARYPSYQRFDLRLDRAFNHRNEKKTVLSLEVLNLFDRDNVSYYRYNNDFSQSFAVHQLPRIFGLGVTAYF